MFSNFSSKQPGVGYSKKWEFAKATRKKKAIFGAMFKKYIYNYIYDNDIIRIKEKKYLQSHMI